jgi:hypothetical protein
MGRWTAIAVGDCCCFHIRQGRMLAPFPLTHSTQFGNQPALLRSRPGRDLAPEAAAGDCRPNDCFLLMTDALAHWFLRECEAGRQPWLDLETLTGDAALIAWLDGRRDRRELRNDDVTLLRVELLASGGRQSTSVSRSPAWPG